MTYAWWEIWFMFLGAIGTCAIVIVLVACASTVVAEWWHSRIGKLEDLRQKFTNAGNLAERYRAAIEFTAKAVGADTVAGHSWSTDIPAAIIARFGDRQYDCDEASKTARLEKEAHLREKDRADKLATALVDLLASAGLAHGLLQQRHPTQSVNLGVACEKAIKALNEGKAVNQC